MKEDNIIFGMRAVIEAINGDKNIDKVYVQTGLQGQLYQELQNLLQKKKVNVSYVPIEKINKLSKGNHQGVVATISPIEFSTLDLEFEKIMAKNRSAFFLILDQITDARNFGAIIRTAECCGVDAIIIPKKGGAPVNADTIKTSAGAVFNIPIIKVDHIKDAVYYMQSSGVKVVAASEKASNTIFQTELKEAVAVVMGNEEKGVSEGVLKIVDCMAKLPILGSIASLNVSVACGAILYEVVRQRQ